VNEIVGGVAMLVVAKVVVESPTVSAVAYCAKERLV